MESSGDYCVCRKRKCDSPSPANGGSGCDGRDLDVTNCTQHGQWTTWSEWSACSKSCDLGMRSRRRNCGNPAPAFGGRVCVGQDVDNQFCDNLPNCPKTSAALVYDNIVPGSGIRFSPWSEWSDCSSECCRGFSRGNRHVLEVKDVLIFATRSSRSVRRLPVPIIFKFISDKLTSNVSASNGQCDRMME